MVLYFDLKINLKSRNHVYIILRPCEQVNRSLIISNKLVYINCLTSCQTTLMKNRNWTWKLDFVSSILWMVVKNIDFLLILYRWHRNCFFHSYLKYPYIFWITISLFLWPLAIYKQLALNIVLNKYIQKNKKMNKQT